jgi:hypothetical protein
MVNARKMALTRTLGVRRACAQRPATGCQTAPTDSARLVTTMPQRLGTSAAGPGGQAEDNPCLAGHFTVT